jgi:hypothetical protein
MAKAPPKAAKKTASQVVADAAGSASRVIDTKIK